MLTYRRSGADQPVSDIRGIFAMSLLQNIKVGPRLAVSFMVLLAILLAVSASVWNGLSRIEGSTRHIVGNDASKLQVAAELDRHSQNAALLLLQIISTPDQPQRVPLYAAMDEANRHANEAFQRLKALPWTPEQAPPLQQLSDLRARYSAAFSDTVDLVESNDPAALARQYASQTRPALQQLLAATTALSATQQGDMNSELAGVLSLMGDTRLLLLIFSAVAVAAGLLLSWSVTRSITGPLEHSVAVMGAMAQGDLRSKVSIRGRDETSLMLGRMSQMQAHLAALVQELRHSANIVADTAASTRSGAVEVASGVERQQVEIHQINAVVEAFAGKLHSAAHTAIQAQDRAKSAAALAQRGQSLIQTASSEITAIAGQIQGSAAAMDALRQRANSMRDMIEAVTDIADQTNMLALNAAIEAARAGELGRGFAVVADEVRRLADRTAKATREINDVISAIDNQTTEAMVQIEQGQKEMARGVDMIREIVEPLTELKEGATETASELDRLVANIAEQVSESQVIAHSVATIAQSADESLHATQGARQNSTQLLEVSNTL
ncbi:methyl-accepting chemotaxis protein [Chromobacterium sphagni]|nr:methyl-accepting chemotaxis protein [Chromobacterium sphagni]OHX20711.1 hypothetical protein BI344_14425 [Chromobacterium sphagni]